MYKRAGTSDMLQTPCPLRAGRSPRALWALAARYYAIRYDMIRYYTILYYTIIYYTIRYYTILYYTIRYDTILYYTPDEDVF